MHDAYASIYRINMLIFKISQLNCTNFLVSMQHKKSQPINCEGICIRVCSDVFPMRFMRNPLTNSSHLMHADWKSCDGYFDLVNQLKPIQANPHQHK